MDVETHASTGLIAGAFRSWRESAARTLRAYAERDGRGYPDWAMRYQPIVRRLRLDTNPPRMLLEVGANQAGITRFLGGARADTRIIALDISAEHLRFARETQGVLPVVADMRHLPFADHAFDAVVSVDTLEHIPQSKRRECVREMARVLETTGRAAIAFPCGDRAAEAEQAISAAYARAFGRSLRWLDEHRECGLPNEMEAVKRFTETLNETHRISSSGNANLRVWRAMWLVLLCIKPKRANAIALVLLRAATPVLSRLPARHYYRRIVYAEPRDE